MTDLHDETECTYRDPNGIEVLAYRDERHVVLPADRVAALLDVVDECKDVARSVEKWSAEVVDLTGIFMALDRLAALEDNHE